MSNFNWTKLIIEWGIGGGLLVVIFWLIKDGKDQRMQFFEHMVKMEGLMTASGINQDRILRLIERMVR